MRWNENWAYYSTCFCLTVWLKCVILGGSNSFCTMMDVNHGLESCLFNFSGLEGNRDIVCSLDNFKNSSSRPSRSSACSPPTSSSLHKMYRIAWKSVPILDFVLLKRYLERLWTFKQLQNLVPTAFPMKSQRSQGFKSTRDQPHIFPPSYHPSFLPSFLNSFQFRHFPNRKFSSGTK